MKTFKYIIALLAFIGVLSCDSDNSNDPMPAEETAGLLKVKEITKDNHIIEFYTSKGYLEQGYNLISFRIKDVQTQKYISNDQITASWSPVMIMTNMQHSCPYSEVQKVVGKPNLLRGYIVFQMAGNASEYWNLTLNYTIGETNYTLTEKIDVISSVRQRVASFMGIDGERYTLALIEPSNPQVAINDMKVGLFKRASMMSFPKADGYSIKIDPRMPGMENHGSPNNTDLTQGADGFYHGKVSFTMTGYWKINIQLLNAAQEILKGEAVTEQNPSSSLYLEVEF